MENKFSDELYARDTKKRMFAENDLVIQLETMRQNIAAFVQESDERLSRLETSENTKLSIYDEQIKDLKDHIKRMESGLHLDFKTTQDILKARLEHEMNIERARLDFDHKLRQKQSELQEEQQRERDKIRNDLIIKLGGVGIPLVSGLTAVVMKWLES